MDIFLEPESRRDWATGGQRLPVACRLVMASLLLMTLFGALGTAQPPQPGELMLIGYVGGSQVEILNPTAGSFRPLGPLTSLTFHTGTMAKNNRDLVIGHAGLSNPDVIATLTPGGAYTTLTTIGPLGLVDFDLNQDGTSYMAGIDGSMVHTRLLRVTTSGQVSLFTSLAGFPVSHMVNTIAVDPDTGLVLVGTQGQFCNQGLLIGVDVNTGTFTTLVPGLQTIDSLTTAPRTGHFVAVTCLEEIQIIDRKGSILHSLRSPANVFPEDVQVDDLTGNLYVLESRLAGSTYTASVTEYTPALVPLKTWYRGIVSSHFGLEVYGSRSITGVGSARPGTRYMVDFSFPGMGNATYLGALSFSQRPGIPLGAGMVNLAPDGLFFASLAGALVSGFSGTLDGQGSAVGWVTIPTFVPPGLTFFCSGVATSGTVVRAGNTLGVTVRP